MTQFIFFVLTAYGLTQILVYSDMPILKKLRPTKEALHGYGKVFHCPMCMGFHVGWFLLLLSPWTELFNYELTFLNMFLFGCLSSGTSYIFNMVFSDSGIQFSQNIEMSKPTLIEDLQNEDF